jgi:hypothetical protein
MLRSVVIQTRDLFLCFSENLDYDPIKVRMEIVSPEHQRSNEL